MLSLLHRLYVSSMLLKHHPKLFIKLSLLIKLIHLNLIKLMLPKLNKFIIRTCILPQVQSRQVQVLGVRRRVHQGLKTGNTMMIILLVVLMIMAVKRSWQQKNGIVTMARL